MCVWGGGGGCAKGLHYICIIRQCNINIIDGAQCFYQMILAGVCCGQKPKSTLFSWAWGMPWLQKTSALHYYLGSTFIPIVQ